MIRSLRTAVSGLRVNQVRMDVVGNNIANVNTIAFKRSRATFTEVLGQQLLGVGRSAGGSGVNPSIVGLGVNVASIDQNWNQGSLENTNVSTDMALNGDGFFIARSKERMLLTRNGNFTFNREGELVTSNGLNVQGWAFDDQGTLNTGALQDVIISPDQTAPPQETDTVLVNGNIPAESEIGDVIDISTVVYDAQGEAQDMVITYTKTANNEWQGAFNLADAQGNVTPITADTTILTFDDTGQIVAPNPAQIALSGTYPNSADDIDITLDMSAVSQYDGSRTVKVQDQNGYGPGLLAGFGFTPEGILELSFTNGFQQQLFQLSIGNVTNPNGLDIYGESFYTPTSASGEMQTGRAGYEFRTAVISGSLEMSNVDLATEFTDMIVSQRGYQAAARVITTSDEILQETVQLKR